MEFNQLGLNLLLKSEKVAQDLTTKGQVVRRLSVSINSWKNLKLFLLMKELQKDHQICKLSLKTPYLQLYHLLYCVQKRTLETAV